MYFWQKKKSQQDFSTSLFLMHTFDHFNGFPEGKVIGSGQSLEHVLFQDQ